MNPIRNPQSNGRSLIFPMVAAIAVSTPGLVNWVRAESPIANPVTKITGGPSVQNANGEIIPLLWRAHIGKAVTAIPLAEIDHYGIQDYKLDNVALIRELTITTKSLSMIRIYHILPLGAIHEDAAKRLEVARKNAQGIVSGLRNQDDELPVKNYPITTHRKMVEYQVSEVEDINVLFESLDKSMVAYLGRDLVPAQRPLIGVTVTVGKTAAAKASNDTPQSAPSDDEKAEE